MPNCQLSSKSTNNEVDNSFSRVTEPCQPRHPRTGRGVACHLLRLIHVFSDIHVRTHGVCFLSPKPWPCDPILRPVWPASRRACSSSLRRRSSPPHVDLALLQGRRLLPFASSPSHAHQYIPLQAELRQYSAWSHSRRRYRYPSWPDVG